MSRNLANLLTGTGDVKSEALDEVSEKVSSSLVVASVTGTDEVLVVKGGVLKKASINDAALQGPAGNDGAAGATGSPLAVTRAREEAANSVID